MGRRTTIAVAVLTCLTLFSCGSQTEKKTKPDQAAPAADGKNDSGNNDSSKASQSNIGQPGLITLSGEDLIKAAGTKITINVKTGTDADGKTGEVDPRTVTMVPKIDETTIDAIKTSEDTKLFVNIGCDISKRTDLAGLEEKKVNATTLEGVVALNVHTILVCGANPLKAHLITLTAHKVVLESLETTLSGGVESLISIRAHEIEITGKNTITSLAKQDTSNKNIDRGDKAKTVTLLPVGPSINLAAEALSGEGTLVLFSTGESLFVAQPETTKTDSSKLTKENSDTTPGRETVQTAVISEASK